MKALDRYLANLDVFGYEHLSLDPDYVARVLNPKPPSELERANAAQLAVWDAWERETIGKGTP